MATSLSKVAGTAIKEHEGVKTVYSYKNTEKKWKPKRRDSNTVCISPLSNFKEKVKEAKSTLITSKEVFISAIGPSIPHAINLAMVLQSSYTVAMETSTSTVYQSGDNNNGRKYPAPAIKITIDLIETEKSAH